MTRPRVAALTLAALTAFAANSLLTRGALAAHRIDPASFMTVRLVSGAMMLWLITRVTTASTAADSAPAWPAALALAGYAVAFTFAYTRIGAGIGALALFGAVQTTMITQGLRSGERPDWRDVTGLVIAVAGLVVLTIPGASRPPLSGIALMAFAGFCWGIYSLLGRRARQPIAANARNFLLAAPASVIVIAWQWPALSASTTGVLLAALSGAVTSGIGYAIWYTVLPHLSAWRAALVQLLTPVLTAAAAVVILGEAMSARLLMSGALIVGGVLWSLGARLRSRA